MRNPITAGCLPTGREHGEGIAIRSSSDTSLPIAKILICNELRYRTLAELEALFRPLEIELGRAAPVRASAPSCSPALTASAAPWWRASTGSRAATAGFGPCWKPRAYRPRLPAFLTPQNVRSGLKHDIFERLAARETVQIGGHHAPAPVGGCLGAARTMRRDQHIREFMERPPRRPAVPLGRGGVLPPDIESGSAQMAVLQGSVERILVNDRGPRDVD